MPKALDRFWKYGELFNGTNHQKPNCKLCGKLLFEQIHCLKYNLGRILGYEVDPCLDVTLEVQRQAFEAIEERAKKEENKAMQLENGH